MVEQPVLSELKPGMPVLVGGDRIAYITEELAKKFQPGDKLLIVRKTGEILHIPKAIHDLVTNAVDRALKAFEAQQDLPDEQFTQFYTEFANRLANDDIWATIKRVNEADVSRAKAKGRSTTRLVADEKMRKNMIEGLHQWRDLPSRRDKLINSIQHEGWTVEEIVSPCGVVAFVFEGRPNVLADATGVLRSGNTAVFRIGSDALDTAKAMMENALQPSLLILGWL
jgi:glutamate-5-semialdehyde dehydrogenase